MNLFYDAMMLMSSKNGDERRRKVGMRDLVVCILDTFQYSVSKL